MPNVALHRRRSGLFKLAKNREKLIQGCNAPFFHAWSNNMLRALTNLFQQRQDDRGIVNYVRTEWNSETRHLSNEACIDFYNNYLTSKGRIKR